MAGSTAAAKRANPASRSAGGRTAIETIRWSRTPVRRSDSSAKASCCRSSAQEALRQRAEAVVCAGWTR